MLNKIKKHIKENKAPLAMSALTFAGAACTAAVARIAYEVGLKKGGISMVGAVSIFEEETGQMMADHVGIDVKDGRLTYFSLSDEFRSFTPDKGEDTKNFSIGRKPR